MVDGCPWALPTQLGRAGAQVERTGDRSGIRTNAVGADAQLLSATEQLVHDLGACGDYRPQLVPVDRLRDVR